MLAGDFARKLRKLNRKLRIFCGNNDNRPAGIFQVVRGEYTEICGVDKNYLVENSIREDNGNIIRGGWRRTLKVLINRGLINRSAAEKEFGVRLHYRVPPKKKTRNIPLGRRLDNLNVR